MREIIIIGAGAQAKAVVAAARDAGATVSAIYDDDNSRWGELLLGVPITGPVSRALSTGLPAVMAFDDPWQRKTAAEELDLTWTKIVHPTSFLNPSATVGQGSVILEGVVVQPAVVIGRHVMVSANATIAHDCVLDDYVQIGTGVDLAGAVHVAEGANLQIGSVVIPNVRVGSWTFVGPRSAVIRDVPDEAEVEGLPARPIQDDEPPPGREHWPGEENALAIWFLAGTALSTLGQILGQMNLFARPRAIVQ